MSIWNRRNVVLSIAGLLSHGVSRPQSQQTPDRSAFTGNVEQVLSTFLVAFDNLDWPSFRVYFASDVTMFHPATPNIKRIDSPEDFEKAWLGVFARIKKQSGRNRPPYMNLQPQDLRIQTLSPEIALATFHLIDGDTTSRRSILFKQYSDGWKIVHLHASNITVTTA
jgi:ketosteroid isomerase-like protein